MIEAHEGPQEPDEADDIPQLEEHRPPINQLGDTWRLGPHRLLCGDALEAESYRQLMTGTVAQMVFTDPPYNVPISGHVCGLGKTKHDEFAMASGDMSEAEFTIFLTTALSNLSGACVEGALIYFTMDWRHQFELLTAARVTELSQINLCVWAKDNGGMGSFYRSQHELVGVFKVGDAPHRNNVQLGTHGRYRTNVWTYPGVNTFRQGRLDDLEMHPTVKPVALVADAIRDCTQRGDIVLDAFAGSGTTIIAAEKTGRIARGIELDPKYVDVAIRRWERFTGEDAIHGNTGETYKEMVRRRYAAAPGSRAKDSVEEAANAQKHP